MRLWRVGDVWSGWRAAYSPSQPRDEHGRWKDGAGVTHDGDLKSFDTDTLLRMNEVELQRWEDAIRNNKPIPKRSDVYNELLSRMRQEGTTEKMTRRQFIDFTTQLHRLNDIAFERGPGHPAGADAYRKDVEDQYKKSLDAPLRRAPRRKEEIPGS